MPSIDRLRTRFRRARDRRRAAAQLRLVSGREFADGPIVFAVMRNETLRLPRFLAHYRQHGVAGFVVVENNSTDATREDLAAQPDVCLYATAHPFTGKVAWLDYLLRKHGTGRWCLVVDADELLVYPSSDRVNLPALCRYLDETGANALHAILLDLYPRGPLAGVNYAPGDDYLARRWYFDPFDTLTRKPRHFYASAGLDFRFHGGVRRRLFGLSPCCSKFPLLRFDRRMYLTDGQHSIEGARFSPLRAALYHFKYLQDFEPHAREEARRGQHWSGAAEYKVYADAAARGGSLEIWRDASIPLIDAAQLEELGFLVRPESFAAIP